MVGRRRIATLQKLGAFGVIQLTGSVAKMRQKWSQTASIGASILATQAQFM